MELSVRRLKRTRPAQLVKRAVRRRGTPAPPRLSVVVPFHDAVGQLRDCVESLLGQSYANLEIVLVDDGSVDGSAEIAQGYGHAQPGRVRVVSQEHRGVGAARNAGVAAASGELLAFCDADDTVPRQGYERMVAALHESGSDLCVGSLTLQVQGQHQEPLWARRSNAHRRIGVTPQDHPEIMANLMPGPRVFRRSFWDEHGLSFATEGDHSDIVTIVRSMLEARTIDIIPSVVYRWGWREDGRSLWQQGLLDRRRVADRVAQICAAGELVVATGSEPVQKAYFAEILHTTVPDLVRAAVTRDNGYWDTLGTELRRLLGLLSEETFPDVPVEDRIIAWLCAHDEREATEEFLEYAFDNQNGYPHRMVGDHPHITLPFIDALAEASDELTGVARSEMRYRTRLLTVRWSTPTVLTLEGAAFIEYLDDAYAASEIVLVLRDRGSGRTWRLGTQPAPDANVNQWSARAHEDHTGAAFRCDVDVSSLPRPESDPVLLDVTVELRTGAHRRAEGFQSRAVNFSAGLLEAATSDGVCAEPRWEPHAGLSLELRVARRTDLGASGPTEPVQVADFSADAGVLRLQGSTDRDVEIALVGPRARTGWAAAVRTGDDFVADIEVFGDEWGVGRTSLPADRYTVLARTPDGESLDVGPHPGRCGAHLPPRIEEDSGLHFIPHVSVAREAADAGRPGRVAVEPAAVHASPAPRRGLSRAPATQPLVDVVLFETFAGQGCRRQPGGAVQGARRTRRPGPRAGLQRDRLLGRGPRGGPVGHPVLARSTSSCSAGRVT